MQPLRKDGAQGLYAFPKETSKIRAQSYKNNSMKQI